MSARLAVTALLVFAAVAQARPSKAAPKKAPPAAKQEPKSKQRAPVVSVFGEVASVTAAGVYLNRGSVDGVQVGQKLQFTRGGKAGGTCTVGAVSEHFARCEGGGLQLGDRFNMKRTAELAPLGPGALPTEQEIKRRAAMVEQTTWRLRDFDQLSSDAALSTRIDASLSHTTYFGGASGPFGVQRLDVLINDFEIWKGLRISADITALNFSARPAGFRSAFSKTPDLLVRQLEVGFRRADIPFSASLGRTWLKAGAGLLAIDGAQAAWKFSDGFELGAWGGLLPDAAYLTITPTQWSAGAFGRLRASFGDGAKATLFQAALRAGWSQRDLLGGRAEIGLNASLWAGTVADANLAVELGFGQSQALAGIDAARLDLGVHPSEKLRINGSVRYRGLPLTGLTEVGTISPGQRAIHGDLGGLVELTPGLWVAVQSGIAADFDSKLTQFRVGPELSMPRVLGSPVGLGFGYMEEIGWIRGRFGYGQVQIAPSGVFRLTTRFNWFQQQDSAPNPGLASHELGTSVALEVSPWRFIRARVAFMGRLPMTERPTPLGSVQVQIGGGW
ncbi:MAG: hypothetical protein U0228_26175 [Myxococcaceae bacterium]